MHTLTSSQQQLVTGHMSLVRICVNRQIRRLPAHIASREEEDMLQEGAMGLAVAASRYRPGACGAFAPYAMSYIQGAICRHLVSQMDGLAISNRMVKNVLSQRKHSGADKGTGAATLPQFYDLETSLPYLARQVHKQYLRRRAEELSSPEFAESQADLAQMRQRYQQALCWAGEHLKRSRRSRPDRGVIIDAVIQERLLVPAPEFRTAMRTLSRRFACSTGRLWQCERSLLKLVRRHLGSGGFESTSCEEVFGRSVGSRPEGSGADLTKSGPARLGLPGVWSSSHDIMKSPLPMLSRRDSYKRF